MSDTTTQVETRRITYDDKTVRDFIFASVGWGLIGMLVGLLAALQLSSHIFNFDLPWLTFSRIRPLHTNAVIFALVGNMMFAGIYYSSQRLLKVRMASDLLSKVHMWGWQLIILGAVLTLPFGITQSKEYAELEWFLDIAVVLVWVAFAINFFWTLAIRNERNLYVAIWFYISTIITIAVLYIVNNLALPVTGTKSYSLWSGAQDALTQWWYGHNAVAFFLTTPILGIMYYFLPKAAGRPVYSYRLSIVHFWALVFIYIWAGPHHLLYTALPDWAQTLGMIFSLMLWAPSWGGMLNGLLTLRGAWGKVRSDPVLKFFVAGVTFYGMATFEGPLLSVKSVSALAHYTDWIIGHVHAGALGWNGFMAAGLFYWLIPQLYGKKLYSKSAADLHFWIGTVGILFYVAAMWTSGIMQGLMWRAQTPDGALLYPDWMDIIDKAKFMYAARSLGGGLFITGWIMMIWNLWKTVKSGSLQTAQAEVVVLKPMNTTLAETVGAAEPSTFALVFGKPMIISLLGMGTLYMMAAGSVWVAVLGLVILCILCLVGAFMLYGASRNGDFTWHGIIERRPLAFTLLVVVAVVAGGVVELVPGIILQKEVPVTASGEVAVKPYTPLELEGRDIYVREGCYNCHSQMIRPFVEEAQRYGPPSRIEESIWDHPFQWGSKRTGPDLARIGVKMPGPTGAVWHYNHMNDPRSVNSESNMPSYSWMLTDKVQRIHTEGKMKAMKALGVPYTKEEIARTEVSYDAQADQLVVDLKTSGAIDADRDSEIIALIAYLQRLGLNKPAVNYGGK